uniref:Uncharacterized protein n=1 Tax=Lactuca sativa TaxID=4236 RepID=A0A9R1XX52_LACSA|nr:hypothetical protein LSAT_V11C200059460 [Lactuca sativa]
MCWTGRLRFSTWSPELYPERVFVFKGKKYLLVIVRGRKIARVTFASDLIKQMHEIKQQISGVTIGMVVSRAEGPVSKANCFFHGCSFLEIDLGHLKVTNEVSWHGPVEDQASVHHDYFLGFPFH